MLDERRSRLAGNGAEDVGIPGETAEQYVAG